MGNTTRWISTRLAIAVGLYAVLYTTVNVGLTRAIESEKAWLKREGLPASPDELMAPPFSPDVRPEDDARWPFEAAVAMWRGLPEEEQGRCREIRFEKGVFRELTSEGYVPMSRERSLELKDWMDRQEVVLPFLKEAASRPASSRSIDYRDGPSALAVNAGYAHRLAAFAGAAAGMCALEKDPRAFDRWEAILGASQGISGDRGCLVNLLVQIAVERDAVRILREILEVCRADASVLERVSEALVRLPDWPEAHARAMAGEEAGLGIMIWESWLTGTASSVNRGGSPAGLLRVWLAADYLAYLRLFRRIHERRHDPTWEILGDGPLIEEAFERDVPRYAVLTRSLMPALDRVRQQAAASEATRLVARYGVQLARYRLATGSYPETLAALAPDLRAELPDPVDPCTGKPLVYRREGEGFVVYSLGQNQKDDGGVAAGETGSSADSDDIAFRLSK